METVDLYFSNQLVCFRGITGILFQGEIHPGAIFSFGSGAVTQTGQDSSLDLSSLTQDLGLHP